MAKSQLGQLYDMIKSMTRGEKRTFKLFSKIYAGDKIPKYIKLFDLLDKTKEFDEEKMEKRALRIIKGNNNLAQVKRILKSKIIQGLLHHQETTQTESITTELTRNLQEIELLYEKGLYKVAMDIVQKAKNLANKYEEKTLLLPLIAWERKLHIQIGSAKTSLLHEISMEEKETFEIAKQIASVWDISFKINIFHIKEGSVREGDKYLYMNDLLEQQKQLSTNSVTVNIITRFNKAISYRAKGKMHLYFNECKNIFNLIEKYPSFIEKNVNFYAGLLGNFILSHFHLRNYVEATSYIEKLGELHKIKGANMVKIQNNYYGIKIVYLLGLVNYPDALEVLKEIEIELLPFLSDNEKLTFIWFYVITNFGIENYNEALEWVNYIMDNRAMRYRHDLYSLVRVFNLIIHYELDNTILLSHSVRSTYRYLQKLNRLTDFEKIFITFLKKNYDCISKKELKQNFMQLRYELKKLADDPSKNYFLEYFDFITWLDAKIENITFIECLKKKQTHDVM